MIDRSSVVERLKEHYPMLEVLSDFVLRGTDSYDGRPYAIRYFDLSDDVVSIAQRLHEYQERVLAPSYFDPQSKSDLRWNHYLYFLTSRDVVKDEPTAIAKASIEANREYARKFVLASKELDEAIGRPLHEQYKTPLPPDPLSEWSKALERHNLTFVVDEALQVPAVARHIAKGDRQGLKRPPIAPELSEAEIQVAQDRLRAMTIKSFRRYPIQKSFDFGAVNLILGVNGVGKTSLLEAIEYLFCGRVRRIDGAPPKASVTGYLASSGLELATHSKTAIAKLRARHLAWYGKADVRSVTLDDSFGKFNFLDTDAAARLTVEQSQERIDADLTQLLLGAEAAKTLERFERLSKALVDMKRDLERDIQIVDQRRLDATARLAEIKKAPLDSDQLLRQLNRSLRAVGWVALPLEKKNADEVGREIQSALVSLGVLRASGTGVPSNRKELNAQSSQLSRHVGTIKEVLASRREADKIEVQGVQANRTIDARLEALGRVFSMLDANLAETSRALVDKEARVASLATSLIQAELATRIVAEIEPIASLTVRRAVEDFEGRVHACSQALNTARSALNSIERTQETLTNLEQELRNAARHIVAHRRDETHCPLCGTQFSRAALQQFLREGPSSDSREAAVSARQQVQDAEQAFKHAGAILGALRSLADYQTSPGNRASVRTLVAQVAADREEMQRSQGEVEGLRQQVLEHEKQGRTLDRLAKAADQAGVDMAEVNRKTLENVRANLTKQRVNNLDVITKAHEDRAKCDDRLSNIASEVGITSTDGDHLLDLVSRKLTATEQAVRAIGALAEKLKVESISFDLEFEAQLREAQEATNRLNTAMLKEDSANAAITKESKLADDSAAEVAALRVQAARIDSALNVISDLVQKHSGEALTNQVLRENGAQIAATFGRIHAPSEFDVSVDEDGLVIKRRATESRVNLSEMSSGQRAAFALSLFLAMNGRLRTGPTAVIFDDPVAHVDDINTLSFVDHLREIALQGDRQIFFATADSKLAGLFARKFRFMGDQFKQIELERD